MDVPAAWFSNICWWVQLCFCGAGTAGTTPLHFCCLAVPVRIAPLRWHTLHILFVPDWRSSCSGCSWKHPACTWISRFHQLPLVLTFLWPMMTSDICSIHGYGKTSLTGRCLMLQTVHCHLARGPAGARRGTFQHWLQAVLVPGWSLFVVWAVLGDLVVERRGWSAAVAL